MAKPKPNDDQTNDKPTEAPKLSDQLLAAQREADAAYEAYKAKKRAADGIESQIAGVLIAEKDGAPTVIGGVEFVPKKSPTRKAADGSTKAPEFPFQLVRKGETKATVDL